MAPTLPPLVEVLAPVPSQGHSLEKDTQEPPLPGEQEPVDDAEDLLDLLQLMERLGKEEDDSLSLASPSLPSWEELGLDGFDNWFSIVDPVTGLVPEAVVDTPALPPPSPLSAPPPKVMPTPPPLSPREPWSFGTCLCLSCTIKFGSSGMSLNTGGTSPLQQGS